MPARTMPVLFIGHGSPMNAIQSNLWSKTWNLIGAALPRPKAIVCISAHWTPDGIQVTGSEQPATIHDFYGFPQALFDLRYPAPGSARLAQRITRLLGATATIDAERGLDHGAWSVLVQMFPQADIPVVQLGIDLHRDGAWHYALAQRLNPLRDEGILILASGNIVHNLRLFDFRNTAPAPWALRFRDQINELTRHGNHPALMDWPRLTDATLAIPTPEHYIPLLYALANGRPGDAVTVFNDDVVGSLSMTSMLIDIA